jgi:hypothetical protein
MAILNIRNTLIAVILAAGVSLAVHVADQGTHTVLAAVGWRRSDG